MVRFIFLIAFLVNQLCPAEVPVKPNKLTAITNAQLASGDLFTVFDLSAGITKKLSLSEMDTRYLSGAGTGTVTSVGVTVASALLGITGSPITTDGVLDIYLPVRAANLVFAGPNTGSSATPTFRSLVEADIPSLSIAKTTGLQNALDGKQSTGNYITALTGDVTASGPGSAASTIGSNKVINSMLAQVSTQTFKGRTSGSTGNVEDLTATQATAMLNAVVGDSGSGGTKGLVPAPGSGDAAANKFLKASGSWATPGGTLYRAIYATDAGQAISSGNAFTTVVYEDEVYKSGTGYNTSNGTLTAPSSGFLTVTAGALSSNVAWAGGNYFQLSVFVNGSERRAITRFPIIADGTNYIGISGECPLGEITAGDTVEVKVKANRGGGALALHTDSTYNWVQFRITAD